MADMAAPSSPSSESSQGAAVEVENPEDQAYHHESALNANWTGARLAIAGLTFLFACFVFAYFYLRSLNSSGRWQGSGYVAPSLWIGTTIMLLGVVSACVHWIGLQRIKSGYKSRWQIFALVALGLGLAAVAFQIYQLTELPFPPGSSGYSSVFTGFYPVFLTIQLCAMVWLEMLLARSRFIPAMSFVEQPPTYTETFSVQRFQASLSGFSIVWNYLALIALLFWFLFYAL
jgi:heme/copper-type cytochrome/quinol oxidase subunit 3